MEINKNKCNKWINLMLKISKLTPKLNANERKYIQACFSIALGKLELSELKEKVK